MPCIVELRSGSFCGEISNLIVVRWQFKPLNSINVDNQMKGTNLKMKIRLYFKYGKDQKYYLLKFQI